MLVRDILKRRKTIFSFEFFPPKTEAGWDKLFNTISDLQRLKPGYVSVTYGAGGSTRKHTHQLVTRIKHEANLEVVAHLTCVGTQKQAIADILADYDREGVENILALRGDPPRGMDPADLPPSDFPYAADLVTYIKKHYPHMGVAVAGFPEGHPQTPNRLKEIEYLKAKVDAGADYIVTQLFFDNRDYYDFCERCEVAGITVPIVAGIMPITGKRNMERIAELAAGARYPAKLLRALGRSNEKEAVERVGIHWATEQILDLLDNGVTGIHLYTLNTSTASLRICESLGIQDYSQV